MIFHTDFTNVDSLALEFDLFRADLRLNFNWSARVGELFLRLVVCTIESTYYYYFEKAEIKDKILKHI